MSLRRKSCDACFKSRRKCDRVYPACAKCRRAKRDCQYAYPIAPQAEPMGARVETTHHTGSGGSESLVTGSGTSTVSLLDPASVTILDFENDHFGSFLEDELSNNDTPATEHGSFISWQYNAVPGLSSRTSPILPTLSIPSFMGGLGELQRVEGCTDSWQWVINELKRCPQDFVMRGETLFLHKELHHNFTSPATRAALGISATFCLLNENNRQIMYQAVDAEVFELLKTRSPRSVCGKSTDGGSRTTLIEELAQLQALLLYQMIRMFGGGLEQRAVVEQQQGLLTTWALQLLRRSQAESGDSHRLSDDWHAWIVAESIRRTVMIIYMFYAMYSIAMHGICVDFATLAKLPVSTSPGSWQSEDAHSMHCSSDETVQTLPYEVYTQSWMTLPHRTLNLFDKFLIIPCKGIDTYKSLAES